MHQPCHLPSRHSTGRSRSRHSVGRHHSRHSMAQQAQQRLAVGVVQLLPAVVAAAVVVVVEVPFLVVGEE